MNRIQVKILNPEAIKESEKMMVCAARLTQSGHKVKDMNDFMNLYEKSYTDKTVKSMTSLPHPTIQKFGVINVVIVGASRRFLAQITRHQNEVKFMSASLQYSDYSGEAGFVIPYNILAASENVQGRYLSDCSTAMKEYEEMVKLGLNHDEAGYMAPQSLRNILIISATPYQWKHLIAQRTCRRNTLETRYVMLKVWEKLFNEAPGTFGGCFTGPFCMQGTCKEGKMSCGRVIPKDWTPTDIIKADFPLLAENEDEENMK